MTTAAVEQAGGLTWRGEIRTAYLACWGTRTCDDLIAWCVRGPNHLTRVEAVLSVIALLKLEPWHATDFDRARASLRCVMHTTGDR